MLAKNGIGRSSVDHLRFGSVRLGVANDEIDCLVNAILDDVEEGHATGHGLAETVVKEP